MEYKSGHGVYSSYPCFVHKLATHNNMTSYYDSCHGVRLVEAAALYGVRQLWGGANRVFDTYGKSRCMTQCLMGNNDMTLS